VGGFQLCFSPLWVEGKCRIWPDLNNSGSLMAPAPRQTRNKQQIWRLTNFRPLPRQVHNSWAVISGRRLRSARKEYRLRAIVRDPQGEDRPSDRQYAEPLAQIPHLPLADLVHFDVNILSRKSVALTRPLKKETMGLREILVHISTVDVDVRLSSLLQFEKNGFKSRPRDGSRHRPYHLD
jgi:hypothetical protein